MGWLWTSLVFFIFLATHPLVRSKSAIEGNWGTQHAKALTRFGLVTLWWILVTQWFFGPPIMDRGFTLTGGACAIADNDNFTVSEKAEALGITNAQTIAASATCRVVGGHWEGGHDLSGHVFLLVLGSAFLTLELLPVLWGGRAKKQNEGVDDGSLTDLVDGVTDSTREIRWSIGAKAVTGLVVLWWWMLFMTSIFFHTWFEKVRQFCYMKVEQSLTLFTRLLDSSWLL
jgi:Inositol phospholipid synthesis and fat-storage-inducing TM